LTFKDYAYLRLKPSIGHHTGGELDEYTIACKFRMSNRRFGSAPGFLSLLVGHGKEQTLPPGTEDTCDQESEFGHVTVVFGDQGGHHLMGCYDPDPERLAGCGPKNLSKGGMTVDVAGCVHALSPDRQDADGNPEPLDFGKVKNEAVTMVASCRSGRMTFWLQIGEETKGPYHTVARVKVPIDAICNAPGYKQPFGDLYWMKIWADDCLDAEAILHAHTAPGPWLSNVNASLRRDERMLALHRVTTLELWKHADQQRELRKIRETTATFERKELRNEQEVKQDSMQDNMEDVVAFSEEDSSGYDTEEDSKAGSEVVSNDDDDLIESMDARAQRDMSIYDRERVTVRRFKSATRAFHKFQVFEDGTWIAGKFDGDNFKCGRRCDGRYIKSDGGTFVDVAHHPASLQDAQFHYLEAQTKGIRNGFLAPANSECPLADQIPSFVRRRKHPLGTKDEVGDWVYDQGSHEFVGLRVVDTFEILGRKWGTIIARLPRGHGDSCLWKVLFDDSDVGLVEHSEDEIYRMLNTAKSMEDPRNRDAENSLIFRDGHVHYLKTAPSAHPKVGGLSSGTVADTSTLWTLMTNHGTLQQMNQLRAMFGIVKGKEQSDPNGFGMIAMTEVKDEVVYIDPTAKHYEGKVPKHLESEDYINVSGGGYFLLRDVRANAIAATYFINDADHDGETKTANMQWTKVRNDSLGIWQLGWRITAGQGRLDKRTELLTRYRMIDAPQNSDPANMKKRQRNINGRDDCNLSMQAILDSGVLKANDDDKHDGDGESERAEFIRSWLDCDVKQLVVKYTRCEFDPVMGLNVWLAARYSGNIFKDNTQPCFGNIERTLLECRLDHEMAIKLIGKTLHLNPDTSLALKEWLDGGQRIEDGQGMPPDFMLSPSVVEEMMHDDMVNLPAHFLDTNWLQKTHPDSRGDQEFVPAELRFSHKRFRGSATREACGTWKWVKQLFGKSLWLSWGREDSETDFDCIAREDFWGAFFSMDTAQMMVTEKGDFILIRPGTTYIVITLESSIVLHGSYIGISTLDDTMAAIELDEK
jgi:hypothetical protein